MNKVLVIAPHPDDEVLGCGGTIRRLVNEGTVVTVAICTKGTPLFPESQVERVRDEAKQAARRLGLDEPLFMDLPVTQLHLMPEHELNARFAELIRDNVRPDAVFLPHRSDRHEDHRQIFDAAMVAMRPDGRGHQVADICCYETVSETHWSAAGIEPPFDPNMYVDITGTLPDKLDAMRCYQSQLDAAIPARTLEAIEALGRFRGSVVGFGAAETFHVVRRLLPI